MRKKRHQFLEMVIADLPFAADHSSVCTCSDTDQGERNLEAAEGARLRLGVEFLSRLVPLRRRPMSVARPTQL
jgi:hypothetical protein